ncbi:MAG: hypothetical protein JW749_11370 [Sedimentisphaerales bacterium]|nr:hypothetical protein [Sedimentisphaerales bacterium]
MNTVNNMQSVRILIVVILIGLIPPWSSNEAMAWNGEPWGDMSRVEIVSRADQMIDSTWSPLNTIYNFGYESTYHYFYAGTTYTGEAYSQCPIQDTWAEFYQEVTTTSGGTTYYGNDCSGFVSICWKLGDRYNTTMFESDATSSGGYVDSLGPIGSCATAGLIIGDACVRSGDHIILYLESASGGRMRSMEQTPWTTQRKYWYWSSLDGAPYLDGYRPIRRRLLAGETLSVSLTAQPASGTAPLNVNLTADVSGTASGTINYSFWWNCNDLSTSVSYVSSVCGDPWNSTYGAKFDGIWDDPKTVNHIYSSPGTYSAKVIAERGSAPPAENRFTITVNPPPDTTPPTVAITSPTSNPTYSTSSSPLSIGGTASDNVGVTQVTWSNNRGGSGTCSGTTSWSAIGITLYSGQNVITVTAWDAANNTATDTLTVTYTPPDTTPPTVTITNPTSNPTYLTSNSTISIGGTASDNIGVTQVTWSNDRGGSGTCSGTTSWSASGIALYTGQNVITVTGWDASNNTATDILTVTYTQQTTYTLSLTSADSGSIRVNGALHSLPWSELFAAGANVTLEAVADTGWQFAQWNGDLSGSTNPTSILMNGNKNIWIDFIQLWHYLHVNSSPITGVEIESTHWGSSTNYTMAAPEIGIIDLNAPQYVGSGESRMCFNGWTGSVTSSNTYIEFTMNEDKTITANYVSDPEISDWHSPTETGVPYNEWHDPEKAYSTNNQYTWRTYSDLGRFSSEQSYKNFSFNIYPGSIINGIEVQVEGYIDSSIDNAIRITLFGEGGGTSSQKSIAFGTSETTETYGSPSDLWGIDWFPDDFTNANFGVNVVGYAGNSIAKQYVDHIQVKVYYTTLEGDLDGDGAVNFTDYAIFADNWMDDTCCDPDWCGGTDFDHSGSVDMLNLAAFARYWLEGI